MDQQLFVKGKLLAPMLLVLEEPEPLDKEGKGTEKERHKRSNEFVSAVSLRQTTSSKDIPDSWCLC